MRAVRTTLLSGVAVAVSVAMHLSLAQAQTAPTSEQEVPAQLQEIVVTGSRITSPAVEAISPITVLSVQEIKESGVTRIEDLVNSLPQVVADQGSGLSMASNGTASINLRGLGVQRTLVLINGRRLMGGDPGAGAPNAGSLGYASAADVNQIPVALVERIDVLTGGASSTYGADAVAGVVNFIMNDHFEGVRLDANIGIYNHDNHNEWINPLLEASNFPTVSGTNWDGANKDLTFIVGHNFADHAGNFEGYLGYRRASPITADHRDHAACVLDNGLDLSGGASFSPYVCGGSSNAAPAVMYNQTTFSSLQVAPDGTLVPLYQRYNYAASHYLQRIDERYTGGFFGKYKLNEHAEVYTEFMFMDDSTRGNYAPAGMFLAGGFATDPTTGLRNGNWLVNCGVGAYGNPGMNSYLTANEFATLCSAGSPYGINKSPAGDVQLLMARRNVEGGPRQDEYSHTTLRGVVGARGEISADWTYDASFTYGKTQFTDWHNNDTSSSKMQDALLAVADPRTGQIVCRSHDPGCVPWNVWNPPSPITQQQLTFFTVPGLLQGTSEEDVFTAFVTGDLTGSGLRLPTTDKGLQVVFGAEYRRETEVFRPDEGFVSADLAGIGSPIIGLDSGFHVWEAFTEIRLPLLRNLPAATSLDFETGYRYSSYTSGFDTNTYKFGLTWAPIGDARIRASYNRAVRAPNVAELYKPTYLGADGGQDLCATGPFVNNPAACALTNYGNPIAVPTPASPSGGVAGQIGGNSSLKPEVGNTKDVGLLLTPSFLPGFSATIDYEDIKITDVISSYGANLIQLNCIQSGSATSTFCQMVHRDPLGTLWASPQGYIVDPLLNLGGLENESIDLGLGYQQGLGGSGKIRGRLDGTYLLKLKFSPDSSKPYDCSGRFGPACSPITPKWRHRLAIDWDTPLTGFSTGVTWRFFGQATNTLLDPTTPDYVGPGTIPANGPPPDARIPSISYIDLRASYAWNKVTLRTGVNNLFDKDPATLDTINSGGGSIYAESNTFPSVYDVAGRFIYLSVTVDF